VITSKFVLSDNSKLSQ